MSTRPAQFADIPRLAEILTEAHARSVYAGVCDVDVKEAKRLLVNAIHKHGITREGGFWVEVAEEGGRVEGFIVGLLARVYHIGTHLMASDLFWLATPDVDPRDPGRLMTRMIAWAESSPGVVEIRCGATDVVSDWKRTEKLLRRRGLKPCGGIYRKEVNR